MNLYFDVCCLNRPFDQQKHDLIRLEAEAMKAIFRRISKKGWRWISSEVVNFEISNTPDPVKRNHLEILVRKAHIILPWDQTIQKRGLEIEHFGFDALDSLHIAAAEEGKVDIFLTSDKKLLNLGVRMAKNIALQVQNPLSFIMEQQKNGKK